MAAFTKLTLDSSIFFLSHNALFFLSMKKKTWIFWPAFDTACDHSEGWARVTNFKGQSSDDGLNLHTCNKEKE